VERELAEFAEFAICFTKYVDCSSDRIGEIIQNEACKERDILFF